MALPGNRRLSVGDTRNGLALGRGDSKQSAAGLVRVRRRAACVRGEHSKSDRACEQLLLLRLGNTKHVQTTMMRTLAVLAVALVGSCASIAMATTVDHATLARAVSEPRHRRMDETLSNSTETDMPVSIMHFNLTNNLGYEIDIIETELQLPEWNVWTSDTLEADRTGYVMGMGETQSFSVVTNEFKVKYHFRTPDYKNNTLLLYAALPPYYELQTSAAVIAFETGDVTVSHNTTLSSSLSGGDIVDHEVTDIVAEGYINVRLDTETGYTEG